MDSDVSRASRVSPGGHELSRDFIEGHQRERIFRGLAEVVAERGYPAVTVADIVKRAKIARNTFYESFSSKQDCFLAAFDFVAGELLTRIRAAGDAAGEAFPERLRAGLGAFLAYVAAEPALAHVALIDALSAGSEAMDRFDLAIQRFAPMLRPGRELGPTGASLPEATEETLIGGLVWIVSQRLATGAKAIEGLQPELLEFALTPYIGPDAAREAAAVPSD